MKWLAARGDRENGVQQTERARETVHSTFWRNDDASNMSPTDIPVGILESVNYRPEAHVFPFLYCIGLTWIPFHRSAPLFPPCSPSSYCVSVKRLPQPSGFLFVGLKENAESKIAPFISGRILLPCCHFCLQSTSITLSRIDLLLQHVH